MQEVTQSPLSFSIKANNDETVRLSLTRRSDKIAPDLTGVTVKWQMFKDGNPVITKTTPSQILILDQTLFPGKLNLNIDAADTIGLDTDSLYIHEFVIVDTFGNANNPTSGDWKLTPGTVYLARQYTVQP